MRAAQQPHSRPVLIGLFVTVALVIALQLGNSSKESVAVVIKSSDMADTSKEADEGMAVALPEQKGSLRLVCLSDTHGLHNRDGGHFLRVPPGDVLLYAGDADLANPAKLAAFDEWLGTLPHKHKLVTFGNMDTFVDAKTTMKNAVVVVDRVVEVEGLRIFASPWTPKFVGNFQLRSTAHGAELWPRLLPPDLQVDVLVTHGPPHGYGDRTKGRHVGDDELLAAVKQLHTPPRLWVCGHIHESHGVHRVPMAAGSGGGGEVLLINAAAYYLADNVQSAAPKVVTWPQLQVSSEVDGVASAGGMAQGRKVHVDREAAGDGWKAPVDMNVL